MSSSDFSKVLVKDDRLMCSDSIKYAVYKSGQNITVAEFSAISASSNSHTYNIQVPSETTIIDRRVIWDSQFTLNFSIPNGANLEPAVGQVLFDWGRTASLAPLPLHSLVQTIQATINNNTVSVNLADLLPVMYRMYDKESLKKYNSMTPFQNDCYQNYADAVGSINNHLSSFRNQIQDDAPRGSIDIISLAQVAKTAGNATTASLVLRVREPLMISPFVWNDPDYNGQGFYGIQNLNFVMNLQTNSQTLRVLRCAETWARSIQTTVDFGVASNSKLVFNFLTPKPSDLLSARNVVPYIDLPRYFVGNQTITNSNLNGGANGSAVYTDSSFTSQTIQLNMIPDKILIYVRPTQLAKTNVAQPDGVNPAVSDFACAIRSISINFNNQSGILASATQDQLYRYSVESGCNENWNLWQGVANVNAPTGNGQRIPTSGSYLMLEFGRHIQITEDYYAPGSLGNFNLNFTLGLRNQVDTVAGAVANETAYQIVLVCVNSGIFVCEKGSSATYTGILTKEDVLNSSSGETYSRGDVRRLVGGGFFDSLGSMIAPLKKVFNFVRPLLPMATHLPGVGKYAGKADDFLKSVGLGAPSGGMSYPIGGKGRKLADRLM